MIDVHYQRAMEFCRRGDPASALPHFRLALAANPASVIAHYNLGVALDECDQCAEARQHFETVLQLQPDNAGAHNYLGTLDTKARNFDAALGCFRRAVALRPDFPEAHFNLGMLLLRLGQWSEGFAECEWRWRTRQFTSLQCPHPRWDGSFLRGTLLVHTEQGVGDAIQFARFLPEAARRCERLMLVAADNLRRLFATIPGIAQFRTAADVIPFKDFHAVAPLMSLPHLFGTTLENLPAAVPYLGIGREPFVLPAPAVANPVRKVGIVWAGSPTYIHDRARSCTLADLQPLLDLERVAFYSLQKGPRAAQVRDLPEPRRIVDLDRLHQDFADTAAAMMELDLIVSVDTSANHLAGALGKPVWLLLSTQSDWRWLVDREDSPWYPTMRIFRQTQPGDWRGPVARMAEALRKLGD
jgi:hypothetical protein